MIKYYSGYIEESYNDYESIYLNNNEEEIYEIEYLAKLIEEDIEEYGNYLSVCYYISNEKLSFEEVKEEYLNYLIGNSKVQFNPCYSEYTGFLYVNEDIKIGGHDLLYELQINVGKYLNLRICYLDKQTREKLNNLQEENNRYKSKINIVENRLRELFNKFNKISNLQNLEILHYIAEKINIKLHEEIAESYNSFSKSIYVNNKNNELYYVLKDNLISNNNERIIVYCKLSEKNNNNAQLYTITLKEFSEEFKLYNE